MRPVTTKITRLSFIFCLLVGAADLSFAAIENRPLPEDGVLGVFKSSQIPVIIIDNKEVKLSAGAQIRNQKNVIVQTALIKGENKGADINVLYKKNKMGQIQRMWILTDEEVGRVKSGNKLKPLPPETQHIQSQ